jgi:hypothetical protein
MIWTKIIYMYILGLSGLGLKCTHNFVLENSIHIEKPSTIDI